MRTIFIGDIHGCFDEFMELLSKLNIQEEDRVYILGDMINRGPKSQEVIHFLYENQERFFAIKGNHERGFLAYYQGKKPEFENEQYIKLKKYFQENPEVFAYFQDIPYYREEANFITVHAGIIPDIPLNSQDPEVLTEIYFYKELPWYFSYPEDKKLIFYGHWSGDGVHIRKNTIGLDSGCVVGNYLSAYILEENKLVQVKSQKQYFFPKKTGYEEEIAKKGIYT